MSMIILDAASKVCLICGSSRLRRLRPYAFDAPYPALVSVIECAACHFAWQYPIGRTEEQSIRYFEAAYAAQGKADSDYFDPAKKREIAELELQFVGGLPVAGRSLLDIGAGAGVFAEVASERQWEVTATDPAIDLDRLRKRSSIRAIRGGLEQLSDDARFDIVTLWDVVEHVASPGDLIVRASGFLKEGGWLVIETGNYKSAERIGGGLSHWIYQLDHRWYFSPESMSLLLAQAGFSEVVVSEELLRPGWRGSARYAGPSRAQLFTSVLRDPLHLAGHLATYHNLRKARRWRLPGIGIFAMAARKPCSLA